MIRRMLAMLIVLGVGVMAAKAEDWPTPPYEKPKGFFGKYFGPVPKYEYTQEEKQLQAFWQSYYRTLAIYYASMDNVDWVAYYKKMGYPIDPRFYNPTGMVPGVNTMIPVQPGMPQSPNTIGTVPTTKVDGGIQPVSMTVPVELPKKTPRR